MKMQRRPPLFHLQRQQLAKLFIELSLRRRGHQDGVLLAAHGVELFGRHESGREDGENALVL